jgi:hypothetical protein
MVLRTRVKDLELSQCVQSVRAARVSARKEAAL